MLWSYTHRSVEKRVFERSQAMQRCPTRLRRPRGPAVTLSITISLAFASVPCATNAAAANASFVDEEDDTREAKRLYQEGRVHFETADYLEALASFKGAYQRAQGISSESFRNEVLVALLFNLARAHVKAFTIDGDASHLRQAEDLLGTYLASESPMVHQGDAEELRAEIAELESEGVEPDDAEDGGVSGGEPPDTAASEPQSDEPPAKSGSGLVIGGGVLMGLSAVGLGLMTGGAVGASRAEQDYVDAANGDERETIDARGRTMNGLVVTGGVAAGVLLSAGIALLVVGKRRQRSNVALDVSASAGYAGLGLRGRF